MEDDWTTHPAASRLLAVHALLRRDIAVVRSAVADLEAGTSSPGGTRRLVAGLAVADPAGAFREQCRSFCGFLTSHHAVEDSIFPQLVATEPVLGPVVDRLMSEHHEVAVLVAQLRGEVGRSDLALTDVRARLATLADHLEAHLAYEEEHIGPALARQA